MKISRKAYKIKRYRKTKKQFGGNCPVNVRMEKLIKKNSVEHPMSRFIKKKLGDKYFYIHKGNNSLRSLDNIYVNCFLKK